MESQKITKKLQNQKQKDFYPSEMLTQQEKDLLREDLKQSEAELRKQFREARQNSSHPSPTDKQ